MFLRIEQISEWTVGNELDFSLLEKEIINQESVVVKMNLLDWNQRHYYILFLKIH